MNISTNNYRIRGAEQSYHQFNPQVKLNIPGEVKQKAVNEITQHSKPVQQVLEPQDILSSRELETLQALFDRQAKSFDFYGNNRVKNVQSGFLLDVKG